MSSNIEQLEQQLDRLETAQRRGALEQLWNRAKGGNIELAAPDADVNLHAHTFFSYNAYGYSPSKFAWLARKAGLAAAGIVDFDVLDGLEEFWKPGRLLGLKTCASLESRVFVPEFATRVINSPGEPGIAYHMGVGFPRRAASLSRGNAPRRGPAHPRTRPPREPLYCSRSNWIMRRTFCRSRPNGNATERHLCEAFERKASQVSTRRPAAFGNRSSATPRRPASSRR